MTILNRKFFIVAASISTIILLTEAQGQNTSLNGEYLGQKKPGLTPEIFAPNFISTSEYSEISVCFHPNGKEFYYTQSRGKHGNFSIMVTKLEKGKWTKPQSLLVGDGMVPTISRDGQKLYYSTVDLTDENDSKREPNLWVMQREGGGWSDPKPLGQKINTKNAGEWFPSIADDGTLYFKRTDFLEGTESIYFTEIQGAEYQNAIPLEAAFNTKYNTEDPFMAPDESYVIFSPGGPELFGPMHISFRNDTGWSSPQNMGLKGSLPSLSPDRKYLFFIKNDDVYWVDAQIIENLR